MFHASRSSKWISEGQARYGMTLKRMPSLPVAGNHIKGALFQGPTPLNVIKPNLPSVCPSLRSVKPVSPPSHPRHRLGSAGECSLPLKQPSECNSLLKNCTFKSVPQKPLISKQVVRSFPQGEAWDALAPLCNQKTSALCKALQTISVSPQRRAAAGTLSRRWRNINCVAPQSCLLKIHPHQVAGGPQPQQHSFS